MSKFTEPIRVAYPEGNRPIFEEYFWVKYKGCNTERELLPILPTSFHVNNGYGASKNELQAFCDTLDPSKKYFGICQYDDSFMVDWKGKDVLEFNMSKKIGVEIPLICQPHPYKFGTPKKYIASFIGSRTHPIRNELEKFKNKDEWYISYEPHSIEEYCRVLHESVFTICPRGYGLNSFRTCESLQYGSIPVYLSDKFIGCFDADSSEYMLLATDANVLPNLLEGTTQSETVELLLNGGVAYNKYYTFEGCMNEIIKVLESENAPKG